MLMFSPGTPFRPIMPTVLASIAGGCGQPASHITVSAVAKSMQMDSFWISKPGMHYA